MKAVKHLFSVCSWSATSHCCTNRISSWLCTDTSHVGEARLLRNTYPTSVIRNVVLIGSHILKGGRSPRDVGIEMLGGLFCLPRFPFGDDLPTIYTITAHTNAQVETSSLSPSV